MKHKMANTSIIGKLMVLVGIFVLVPVLLLPWYP